ncbi:ATP-binding protein [Streptomyces sp. NPDC005444]|uniref:sensor histidine kinase n=1 Tax=unclassified Streptomyces TaxID=2593676 RepID=UPI0033BD8939
MAVSADTPRRVPGPRGADTAGRPHAAAFSLVSAQDVFRLRRGAQTAASALGLERQDQVRLATALSELGRDRLGDGTVGVSLRCESGVPPALVVTFEWEHAVVPTAETVQLVARLVGIEYRADDRPHRVVIRQPLPPSGLTAAELDQRLAQVLGQDGPATETDFLRAQTRDLIATLEETKAQREELRRLNEELEETNQGVLALYSELTKELETTNSGVLALHSELDDKSRQLREASEAKTRFWSTVSHELRTPINAVVALSRLLLDPGSAPLSPEQREQIALIGSSGQTVLSLVGDLLDVVKAESGQLDIQREPVDLRLLVAQLGATFESTYRTKDITLVTPESKDYPPVVTDEKLLTHILRNLMSNAFKFTLVGEVRLDIGVHHDDPAFPMLHLTVSDTGVGIPTDDLGRVFDEFYQVRGPHQRGQGGTGLGLPYARRLTELLGGDLTITSTLGTGTCARVVIPVRDQSVTDARDGGTAR